MRGKYQCWHKSALNNIQIPVHSSRLGLSNRVGSESMPDPDLPQLSNEFFENSWDRKAFAGVLGLNFVGI